MGKGSVFGCPLLGSGIGRDHRPAFATEGGVQVHRHWGIVVCCPSDSLVLAVKNPGICEPACIPTSVPAADT